MDKNNLSTFPVANISVQKDYLRFFLLLCREPSVYVVFYQQYWENVVCARPIYPPKWLFHIDKVENVAYNSIIKWQRRCRCHLRLKYIIINYVCQANHDKKSASAESTFYIFVMFKRNNRKFSIIRPKGTKLCTYTPPTSHIKKDTRIIPRRAVHPLRRASWRYLPTTATKNARATTG